MCGDPCPLGLGLSVVNLTHCSVLSFSQKSRFTQEQSSKLVNELAWSGNCCKYMNIAL